PMGLGWFVQYYKGERVVWHFGNVPNAYSSLILKLPARNMTFILLANSDGLSSPFDLAQGDVTRSLFASLFLKLATYRVGPSRRRTVAVCCLCLLLAPRAASAEWHFTPLLGVTFGGSTTFVDLQHGTDKKHLNFGGAVSRFGEGVLGVEGIVIYTRHFFEFD